MRKLRVKTKILRSHRIVFDSGKTVFNHCNSPINYDVTATKRRHTDADRRKTRRSRGVTSADKLGRVPPARLLRAISHCRRPRLPVIKTFATSLVSRNKRSGWNMTGGARGYTRIMFTAGSRENGEPTAVVTARYANITNAVLNFFLFFYLLRNFNKYFLYTFFLKNFPRLQTVKKRSIAIKIKNSVNP